MAEILIMAAMLMAATIMLGALSLWGEITSQLVFIVLSFAVLAFSALTLLINGQSPYLPYVALTLAFMAILIAVAALFRLVFNAEERKSHGSC